MRCKPLATLLLLFPLALAAPLRAAETEAQRAERLAKMTAEQKEELLRKKDRFDALPADEKARLRGLHAEIEATSHARQLHQTLTRYNDWLKTLSSAERAELLGLACDERIAKIREILKRQESLRFREFAGTLPEQDRDAIYRWLEAFVDKHEDELLKLSPWSQFRSRQGPESRQGPDSRQGQQGSDSRQGPEGDPKRHRRMLMFTLLRRGSDDAPSLVPTAEDVAELMPKLSQVTRHEIERTPADRKPEVIRELVRATVYSKSMPQVSEDELRKFFAKLDPTDRERLEALDREQMRRELTRMYHASQFRRGGQPGFGMPPGPGFGMPPGSGFRKPDGDGPPFGPRGGGPPGGPGPSRGGAGRDASGEGNRRDGERKEDARPKSSSPQEAKPEE